MTHQRILEIVGVSQHASFKLDHPVDANPDASIMAWGFAASAPSFWIRPADVGHVVRAIEAHETTGRVTTT